jgi:SOS response regulatory protein OraA/RecX
MEDILSQLVTIYRAQGEEAVREQLKKADLPDEQIDVFIAKVERRIQAEDAPRDNEADKMMKLITADYMQNGEAVVRTRLQDSGMDDDLLDQTMADVKLLAQAEMQLLLKQQLDSEGEDAVRQTLKQQGTDDATIDAVVQALHDMDMS